MFHSKKTKLQLALATALLSSGLNAETISGVIYDNNGNTLSNATIEIAKDKVSVQTDENGRFSIEHLTTGENKLHIFAPGFAHLHQTVVLTSQQNANIQVNLKRSPIEVIDIVATPLHMSVMESAAPVNVIAGENLRRQQTATLGDSLEKLAGVHTSFHANVASTPIIRGLSGPRVLIAQNGLDVSDVSRVGPDHSVASEASTAQQIEVLRGPATLFYGSGAIGGVVNVVDQRVPTSTETRGEWLLETASVNDQKLASFNLNTGADNVAFYADGYWREANDYEIPDNEEPTVANSDEKSNGFTLGSSYLFDSGFVGLAVEHFNREYGIPGHSHGEEEEGEDHEHEAEEAERVFADLEQTRVQLLSEVDINRHGIEKINFRSAFTDYQHVEIENGAVGTTFKNKSEEVRLDVLHAEYQGWTGGLSFHYKNSDISAQGEEAFTPPSSSQTLALAVMEEKRMGDFLFQLGARIEQVKISSNEVLLPALDIHSHDEDDHEGEEHHDEDEHHEEGVDQIFNFDQTFTPVSLSAGIVWDFSQDYNLGLSLSRSERAPSATELLSFGPHIGTRTYEVGALFELDREHLAFERSANELELETANNIDLTLRKKQGNVGFVFNAFYNQIDNYYYQTATNLFAEFSHDHEEGGDGHEGEEDHEHEGEDGHEHGGELPIFVFQTDDVILNGFEAQIAWQATDVFKATLFSDFVRARVKNGGDLPRTPPLRFGTQLSYQDQRFSAHLDITRYQSQNRISANETATDGYTLVEANIAYDFQWLNQDITAYLKVTNLTDTEARVHTSFLKDIAPRPGRSIALGVRGSF
ncbi:TonB-dependent receptor [Endozoicomonas sp. G2_1]|uniref:TonB-dependent receptor n=1 Tax=Endozoicomonas sp. G2_1 TaxID=2821091 RepID=UPI001ADA2A5A|nr:TonB-dependent receptor [Endozoicomonas sp. G2_1]MBO9490590.1 TonB-dependent receptor [Endozoicomonas sp. G2_1]